MELAAVGHAFGFCPRHQRWSMVMHFLHPHALIMEAMDDGELNTALRAYSEAWRQYISMPASLRVEPVLPAKARAAINKLRAEADRVQDPGGPINNYSDALAAWAAANHPRIDSNEMFMHIVDKLIFDHR